MNYDINQKFSLRRNFQNSNESAHSLLKTSLSPLNYNHVCSVIETKASKIKECNSRKLEKEFNNLKSKFGIPKVSNLNNDDISLLLNRSPCPRCYAGILHPLAKHYRGPYSLHVERPSKDKAKVKSECNYTLIYVPRI